VSAAVVALCSWAVVMCGLRFSPVSTDQRVDLEGGGGFAAALTVYWPALGITLLVGGLVVSTAFTRAWVAATVIMGTTTAAFSVWTLTQDYLMDYRPSLDTYLWLSLALATTALALVALASAARGAHPSPR
jgi:hypothetical protein